MIDAEFEQRIKENADKLILLGKEGWLKSRKSKHKTKMTDEQQEGEVERIEQQRLKRASR